MKLWGTGTKTIMKIVISTALLIFLFQKISLDRVLAIVQGMNRTMMVVAILLFFFSNVVGALQWHLLLKSSGVRLGFWQSFRFYFVGLFFNNFLPANIGGDAVKIYDVSRIGSSVYQVIGVTILDRLIGIFSLCLLAVIATLHLMRVTSVDVLGWYLVIFIVCMMPPAAFYFIKPLGRLLRRIVGSLRGLSMDKRGAAILDFMGEFKAKRTFVSRLVMLGTVVQAMRVLTHVLVGVALGIHVDAVVVSLFFVFVPLLSLAMIPPITINGLGIREGLGILLFSQAGIGRADAFTLEFLTYLVSVVVSLFGLVFFLTRRSAAGSASVEQEGI